MSNNNRWMYIAQQKAKENANFSCIYMWFKKDKKECYIGKATNVYSRIEEYFCCLNGKPKSGRHIDLSLASHPLDYAFTILEKCSKEQLDEREKYWIDLCQRQGCILKNVESGGTNGKTDINKRQEGSKGVLYKRLSEDYDKLLKQFKEYIKLKNDKIKDIIV